MSGAKKSEYKKYLFWMGRYYDADADICKLRCEITRLNNEIGAKDNTIVQQSKRISLLIEEGKKERIYINDIIKELHAEINELKKPLPKPKPKKKDAPKIYFRPNFKTRNPKQRRGSR